MLEMRPPYSKDPVGVIDMSQVVFQIIAVVGFFAISVGTLFGIVYVSHLLSRGQ